MGFKNYRFQIILRVIGIALTIVGFAWSIYRTQFLMTPLVFGLLSIIQIIGLIYYTEWIVRELKRFFDTFVDSDYTRKFDSDNKGNIFEGLDFTFNKIIHDFKKIRIEKEEHYQYLLQINKYVNVGLICFTNDGKIDLMNNAACQLLNQPILTHMAMLENRNRDFYDKIMPLPSGGRLLYKLDLGTEKVELAIAANKFKLGNLQYTLISLQNIHSELDTQEMQAWQKLIRVLTHEIMNSVTPVVSLTTAVKRIMEDEKGKPIAIDQLNEEDSSDIYKSIVAIENRGKGLLDFVNAYRDYTKIPLPEKELTNLVALVNEVLRVLKPSMSNISVRFETSKAEIEAEIDKNLISQVLINLIKNAAEALENTENPIIEIILHAEDYTSLVISDNGPGISAHIEDEIFVPFFTTKAKGNGIGLSLSKQIMKAHGGDLLLQPSAIGSRFEVRLGS